MTRSTSGTIGSEQNDLKFAWRSKSRDHLRQYLVADYHDPRLNVASILGRHFVVDELFPGRFIDTRTAELHHAVEMNRVLARGGILTEDQLDLYGHVWRNQLSELSRPSVSVLEAACGSANDYRFWERYGLAPLLDYRGVDLSDDNIENARDVCSSGEFLVGDAMNLPFDDRAYDLVVVFDLLEHLSPDAMAATIAELHRTCRRKLFIGFWNIGSQSENVIVWKPSRRYHRSLLSIPAMSAIFKQYFAEVQWFHVHPMLSCDYDFDLSYNPLASVAILAGRRDIAT